MPALDAHSTSYVFGADAIVRGMDGVGQIRKSCIKSRAIPLEDQWISFKQCRRGRILEKNLVSIRTRKTHRFRHPIVDIEGPVSTGIGEALNYGICPAGIKSQLPWAVFFYGIGFGELHIRMEIHDGTFETVAAHPLLQVRGREACRHGKYSQDNH